MMYHFMLGLRGCSAACAPSVGGCADDCACSIASFLISCAINVPAACHRPAPLRFLTDKLQQMAQPEFNHFIHHFEKSREHEDSNNDNRSRRLNFFAPWVVDLLHLTADFLEKVFGAAGADMEFALSVDFWAGKFWVGGWRSAGGGSLH